ncbi:MAG TPA: sigma-70 family RNA polymerase sigma factor, partial [Acidimicrobiia bacterium]|nr:sigma-70 family RNA polymerase sigma factor [Acidimicrobiia bacterium]
QMVMIQDESLDLRAPATTDDDLLARLRDGDEAAFRALVDRHRPWLVRFCTGLLGQDVHAAEDAAQESLLKLHAAARRDGRTLRVRPWLTVVARNTCVDEQRKRRPELPGELPERAAVGDDPFALDPALAEAWPRLAGRHREVLYLREVLGFSYKEIGSVMGLTMPATETLVFRARAALRREYERSGGSAFGCGLLGLHLARLGFGPSRDRTVADGLAGATMNDSGLSGLASRVVQWMSTSLPGCGEQAVAKVLSVAAGVAVAAASLLPGLAPFADAPPAAATVGSPGIAAQPGAVSAAWTANPIALKTLLGNAVPAAWEPHQARSDAKPLPAAEASGVGVDARAPRPTPLRDAAAAAHSTDRPSLRRPVRSESDPGPLRSLVPSPDGGAAWPARPVHPVRSLVADPTPLPTDLLPAGPVPVIPVPVASALPDPGSASGPRLRDAVQPLKGEPVATVAGDESALLRRRDR